jgi:hypothetical protein
MTITIKQCNIRHYQIIKLILTAFQIQMFKVIKIYIIYRSYTVYVH